ncbi:MAG TPA: M48 family metallopeptidase [Xanthobacteraceae bacterium]|nr:M48 family metallopeptidase [Xanthobacteraceae bacterium]
MQPRSGKAIYFDGMTSARQTITVEILDDALALRTTYGKAIGLWPAGRLDQLSAPDGLLRVGLHGSDGLERIEIRDPVFAAAVDDMAETVDRTGLRERKLRHRVVLLSIGTLFLLAIMILFAVPAIARRLTPYVPFAIERRMGDAVDVQFRQMSGADDATLCGQRPAQAKGLAVFDALVARLGAAAHLAVPLSPAVVQRSVVNAVALPGGRIYVFQGLIDQAQSPDELAGVIAHELGHVAHRDGVRAMLENGGVSFLFGMLLGDFVGGSAVMIATRTVLHASYSRAAEAAADRFSVDLMNGLGADAGALGRILSRIGDAHPNEGPKTLSDHPQTAQRLAAIARQAAAPPYRPLMSASDWQAVKHICTQE